MSTGVSSMADKLIGSLIYGEHLQPKRRRPLKERLTIPVLVGTVMLALTGIGYKFANFREEQRVSQFLEDVRRGRYDAAYARWDTSEGHYSMNDFMADWGKEGYYSRGIESAKVTDSNSSGFSVIVYVNLARFRAPIALLVDKQKMTLSYSPTNKYTR